MYDLWLISNPIKNNFWIKFKYQFPHAQRAITEYNSFNILKNCAKQSNTDMFFTCTDLLSIRSDWKFSSNMESVDLNYIHVWPNSKNKTFDLDSVILWPTALVLSCNSYEGILSSQIKLHNQYVTDIKLCDIFFITYKEEYADVNWNRFKNLFPRARRVDNIKGIDNAHRHCAMLSKTSMFYTVDADTFIHDNWDFSFVPSFYDSQYVHVWYTKNPINDLEYGYGSVKLWPRDVILKFNQSWIDFTTSIGQLKIYPEIISTTAFNTNEYNTWKSAFRECIKLYYNIKNNKDDYDSIERLKVWENKFNDVPYSEWASKGALDAARWCHSNENINKINDFEWLKEYFIRLYS